MQKPRKTKKQKKLQTPLGLLFDSVDMWSAVLIFLFSIFWPSGANHAKTSKNNKKQKQNCRPHWGSCLTLWTCGLQFCFFLFFWVFRGSGHLEQTMQKPRKSKKTKTTNCRPHWGSCLTLWTCGLQYCFLCFFFPRFWPSGANHAKTSKKQKNKNCRPHWGSCLTLWTCGLQFCVLCFFVFSRLCFHHTSCKHRKC